ncbi:MAG: hypothetical protein V6Z86_06790 [Hyphomicrobiales bacterium]
MPITDFGRITPGCFGKVPQLQHILLIPYDIQHFILIGHPVYQSRGIEVISVLGLAGQIDLLDIPDVGDIPGKFCKRE